MPAYPRRSTAPAGISRLHSPSDEIAPGHGLAGWGRLGVLRRGESRERLAFEEMDATGWTEEGRRD